MKMGGLRLACWVPFRCSFRLVKEIDETTQGLLFILFFSIHLRRLFPSLPFGYGKFGYPFSPAQLLSFPDKHLRGEKGRGPWPMPILPPYCINVGFGKRKLVISPHKLPTDLEQLLLPHSVSTQTPDDLINISGWDLIIHYRRDSQKFSALVPTNTDGKIPIDFSGNI